MHYAKFVHQKVENNLCMCKNTEFRWDQIPCGACARDIVWWV